MKSEDLKLSIHAWKETLASYGVKRSLLPSEEVEIARAIQKHGSEAVELALFGARFEPKTEKFDPADFLKIGRILRPDHKGEERIDRFVNLGARFRAKEEACRRAEEEREQRRLKAEAEVIPVDEQNPQRAQAILSNLRKLPQIKK